MSSRRRPVTLPRRNPTAEMPPMIGPPSTGEGPIHPSLTTAGVAHVQTRIAGLTQALQQREAQEIETFKVQLELVLRPYRAAIGELLELQKAVSLPPDAPASPVVGDRPPGSE